MSLAKTDHRKHRLFEDLRLIYGLGKNKFYIEGRAIESSGLANSNAFFIKDKYF